MAKLPKCCECGKPIRGEYAEHPVPRHGGQYSWPCHIDCAFRALRVAKAATEMLKALKELAEAAAESWPTRPIVVRAFEVIRLAEQGE
jgi:hypothetical protein